MVLSWFRKRRPFAAPFHPRSVLATLFRPRLERLEDRLAPNAHTWTGGVDGTFGNPGNWQGGAVPTPGETNVQLTFNGSANANLLNNVANLTFSSITFNPGAPAYTLHLDTA